jgi:hypothetical protein
MRRGPLVFIAVLPFTTFASAQTPGPDDQARLRLFGLPAVTTQMSPDSVVARVMSFDRDNDGRVTRDELPDRMHNLLSDATGGALDVAAVRARAMTVPAATATVTGRGFQGSGGGYTFGDQISLSTRPHVDGALDDLRLPALTREQAQAIVTPFMTKLETDATEKLVADLHFVLTVSQLTALRMQIERQLSGRPGTGAPNHVVRSSDGKTFQIFMGGPDLSQRINAFGLPAEQTKQALAALESFKERIRPGDAERSELLAQLKDVLNDEERDNFGAALARRPLVKSGLPGMMAGVSSAVVTLERKVVQDGAINNALFIMPKTPAPAPQLLER